MKIDLVFLIVLGIVVAYIFVLYKVESMADVGNLDQIKEAVKQVYLADVEAIRNLSNVASQLQASGLTVPAHMNIKGRMNLGSDANAKDFPDWLGLSVENPGDAHIRLKTKGDENKNVYVINRDGNLRVNTHGIGDMFGVNRDGHTYNLHLGDHVHHFMGRGDNPYITISKEGEWGHKSWYLQNVKNDGDNKIFRIGVHDEGPKLDIHRNGNAFFTGQVVASGRNILAELDELKANAVRYNDVINITNRGTGNHEQYARYLGFCGYGACDMVNVGLTNDKSRAPVRIERN